MIVWFLGVYPAEYFGRLIGSLDSQRFGIEGDVYAVDARTIFIKGFSYDGKGKGNHEKSCLDSDQNRDAPIVSITLVKLLL